MGKKNKSSLGKAFQKSISANNKGKKVVHKSTLYTVDFKDSSDWGRLNLQSVTEESSLQEFMSIAELAQTDFKAEKLNGTISALNKTYGVLSDEETLKLKHFHNDNKNVLRIPRRPKWDAATTVEELNENERDSFLEWRRALALFQESNNVVMTPFEKQLEFWRQLWRTIEKSDILVQIVDARNPLLYRCEDLELYVQEMSENKINILLVNKADFLTENQRKSWAEYFSSINVRAIFFSATSILDEDTNKTENNVTNEESAGDEESDTEDKSEMRVESTEDSCLNDLKEKLNSLEIKLGETAEKLYQVLSNINAAADDNSSDVFNSSEMLSAEQLKNLFKVLHTGPKVTEGITTVGFIGYPNVGKSSTINALLNKKKVSTSSTAGKTKHLQTIYLDHDVLLCDCPGLVMPSFVFTKAELVINGILRVDELRDHVPPVNLVAKLIPRHVIEDTYNIMIPKSTENADRCPTAEELLNAYAYFRGFMTANGQPDNARAARFILKDFQKGKLLYCHAPPNITQTSYHTWPERQRNVPASIPPKTLRAIKVHDPAEEISRQFYNGVHVKRSKEKLGDYLEPGCEKPWKKYNKHANKNKKEKLRRVYAHLDQH